MLLFIDSFDHYATADIGLKWSSVTGTPAINATAGRRGGGAMTLTSFPTGVEKDFAGTRTLIAGCAVKLTVFPGSTPSNISQWITLGNGDGSHLYFYAGTDGSIWVYRRLSATTGDFALLGKTTGAILQVNVYAYLEIKATIGANGTGSVKVLVNGVTVLNLINVTTISYASTTETITKLNFYGQSGSTVSIDDLYICDTSGTSNTDFFGDVRIDVIKPNADGTYRDFTPDTGTAHFSRVNEAVADQTSYVSASAVSAKDSYQFEDLTSIVGVVRGVQIVDAATKDDAGVRSISHLAKSGISEDYSAAMPLSTDRKLYTTIHERDPATGGNWTQASINAAEFGVVVAA